MYAAVLAGGSVVGQIAGGLLVSADLFGTGWRPVFLINVPVGALLVVLAARRLPTEPGDRGRDLDPVGAATLGLSVLLLVVPLVFGHQQHWPTWGWVCLALSEPVFAIFLRVERSAAGHGRAPLLSPRVLHAPGLLAAGAALFLAMVTYGGYLFSMALHLQAGLGESAAQAGLVFTPAAVGFAAAGLSWRRLPTRWHHRVVPAGLTAAALGNLLLAAILHSGHRGGPPLELDLLFLGLGLGLAVSPNLPLALRHVPLPDAADASGLLITVIQLGQVVGVAALGTTYLTLTHIVSFASPAGSGHAIAVTSITLAVTAAIGAAIAAGLHPRAAPTAPAAAAAEQNPLPPILTLGASSDRWSPPSP